MISIRINKKKYKGIYCWEDMTLSQFIALASIEMPKSYADYILADGTFDNRDRENIDAYIGTIFKLTDEDVNEIFPEYFRKVVGVMTNIPHRILYGKDSEDKYIIDNDEISLVYEGYFKPFVATLLNGTPLIHFKGQMVQYSPEQIKSFTMGFKRYYLPATVNILGEEIPLKNEPIVSYIEASDIFQGMKVTKDNANRLALFMGIYCRRKNEKYSEKRALERQEILMNTSMAVVWAVFFYTVRRLPGYTRAIQLFSTLPRTVKTLREEVLAYKDLVQEA